MTDDALISWILLAFLLLVWFLWVFACAAQAALAEARRGIPEEERSGISVFPGFPLFPLAFWGVALLADRFIGPWGTFLIGGAHLVLAIKWGVAVIRDSRDLAKIDGTD